jgi:hypothetical protein
MELTVPWSEAQSPERAIWLKKHQKALDLAVEATRRSRCYFPLVRPADADMLFDTPVYGLQASNAIGQALTVRALLRIREGKTSEAQQDLLACHRLGRLVGSGPFLIHGAVGRAIDHRASLADAALLESGKLTATNALAYRDELCRLPPLASVAHQLDQGERLMFLGFATDLARKQQPELNRMFSPVGVLFGNAELFLRVLAIQMTVLWDEALRAANRDWDRWVAAVRTPMTAGRQKQLETLLTEVRRLAKEPVEATRAMSLQEKGRWMGRSLVAKMLPLLDEPALLEDGARMRADLVQLGLALAAYYADVGEYPTALEALVPKYCSEVPLDRFTAQPLRYRRQDDGFLLCSVGRNGADDTVQTVDSRPQGDDLVLRIRGQAPMSRSYGIIGRSGQLAAFLFVLIALGGLTMVGVRLIWRRRKSDDD